MLRRIMLALVLLLGSAPMAAHAADDARAQAKAFFLQGREHYAAGRLADALVAFEQANALAPHPLMLFNIAQVYEAMEDLPQAIATYEKYLASDPRDADQVRAKVGAMTATVDGWPAIQVQTTPPGAEVRVGAASNPARGETPMTLRLPPGDHRLFFTRSGFEQLDRPLKLAAGQRESLTVALVPIMPILAIDSAPPGATVIIDGQTAPGVTPLVRALPAGAHTVRIELDGFEPVERTVTLDLSHTRKKPYASRFELSKAIPRGELVLSVTAGRAEVLVDDTLVGRAPLQKPLELTEGLHKVVVRPERGDPYEEMITIRAGETVQAEIDLDGGVDLGLVGYIGMGVGGALLAGGAVTGVLALGASGELDDCRADVGCDGTAEESALADDVRGQALLTDVLIGAGVAIAATGAVLWLLDASDAPAEAGAWMVMPIEGGAAAVGHFEF